ncbi:MAG: ArsI/CadI family heavy metal resistance metalloenzyme [Bacteroidota bacterium]|nr:ArsI/CadI family heavy metal resistance metalloenzyme [Bacteroidota bacterium]
MHVSLYVKNITETIDFYTRFFQIEPFKVKSDYVKYVLDSPSLIISFLENPDNVQSTFGHLGFQVETQEDFNIKLWQARKAKIISLEEIQTSCCYAVQDKYWVTDPDGYQWEVYYFKEDIEFEDPNYKSNLEPICCTPKVETI